METTSEEISEVESYKFTYKRHHRPNKNSWIDTNVSDGVSMDEVPKENCEIPSASTSTSTPKSDAVSKLSPVTPDPKDRACRRSLTFDETQRSLKRKARDDSEFHQTDASDAHFRPLCMDDRKKDIYGNVYRRRKQVKNQTPKEATQNILLPDELKGPNETGTKEVVEPDSECNGEAVEEQKEWQKSVESLHGKIRLFMTRMECIIGERKFSKWRGSVMDSIVGAFLTQNVNDVLSSSAFMSLAAKFPQGFGVNSNGETSSSQCFATRISSRRRRRHTNKNKHDAALMNVLKDCHVKYRRERKVAEPVDVVDWPSVMKAKVGEIAQVIQSRGMNNNLANRIKDCLDDLVETFGSTDMEWMRYAPVNAAKKYLLGIYGLGSKSVECIRLLTLIHLAFPIDRNAGRVAIRLGWIPKEEIPKVKDSKKMNLLQEYLWALLSHLDHSTLYELHCQIITFAKVFCTERNPNCSECPMTAECTFTSVQASAMVGDMEDYGLKAPRIRTRAPRMASIPVLKKKKNNNNNNKTSLRMEHQVYVLPENHRVLAEQESSVFHGRGPYLLAAWNSERLGKDEKHEKDVYGTLMIPAREANKGMFPLNGTYFQENEVFADEESSKVPIKVQRASVVDLPCTTLYCGKSMSPVCKGMTSDEIKECFKRGYVCFRGFNTKMRNPVPLPERFHARARGEKFQEEELE